MIYRAGLFEKKPKSEKQFVIDFCRSFGVDVSAIYETTRKRILEKDPKDLQAYKFFKEMSEHQDKANGRSGRPKTP